VLTKHLFWFLLEWMERWSSWDFWKNDLFRSFLKFTSKVFKQDQANVFKLHFVRVGALLALGVLVWLSFHYTVVSLLALFHGHIRARCCVIMCSLSHPT
jgi:hypothetical protein